MFRFIQKDILLWLFFLSVGILSFFIAVVLPNQVGFYLFSIIAALAGLAVAGYIYYGKRYKDHLACPGGESCNIVVQSKYSKVFGIHLEYLGSLYYLTIIVAYGLALTYPDLVTDKIMLAVAATFGAFLFSLYLTFIAQATLLKQWCIWCLLSAGISTIIFVAAFFSISGAAEALAQNFNILEMIKNLGYLLGAGGSAAALFFFSRFLDDFDINMKESKDLKALSGLIWMGLALVLGSEYARYIGFTEVLSTSGPFIAQMIALSVTVIAGGVLLVVFAPFLVALPFEEKEGQSYEGLRSLRKATFISGAIAFSSWFFAFFVNYLPEDIDLSTLILAYIVTLVVSVLMALAWQKGISQGKFIRGSVHSNTAK